MPDLIAALAISPALPGAATAPPPRAATVTLPGETHVAADFGLALSGLLLPGLVPPSVAPKAKGDRQANAETGKELPLSQDAGDPTLIWLPDGFTPMPLPEVPPRATAVPAANQGLDVATAAPALPGPTGVPVAPAALTQAGRTPLPPAALPASAGAEAAVQQGVTHSAAVADADTPVVIEFGRDPVLEPAADPGEIDPAVIPRGRFDAKPLAGDAAFVPPARVTLQPSPAASLVTAGAAAQVFAAALTTPASERASLDRVSEAALLLHGHARAEQQTSVQALSATSQAPLDLTHDDWTGAMIDRIAALRDSAEAAEIADTRIKLAPENLGALEVSIRREGDRIHVHFSAENPAARQMIADAAPRLNELADARGVKLGQTSVDGGSEQGARRDAQQQSAQTPARNLSAERRPASDGDERIA